MDDDNWEQKLKYTTRSFGHEMGFQFPKYLLLMGESHSWGNLMLNSGVGLKMSRFLLLKVGPEKECRLSLQVGLK